MRGISTAKHHGYVALAALPGLLYGARSVWALAERRVDHAAHSATGAQEWAVLGNLLLLALLVAATYSPVALPGARGIRLAVGGIAWVILARTAEALQIPGPWGFYGSPGVAAVVAGLLWAGASLRRIPATRPVGDLLCALALLRLGGGAASMLLFNLLGRTDEANWTATVAGRSLHIAEAAGWILIGLALARGDARLRHPAAHPTAPP